MALNTIVNINTLPTDIRYPNLNERKTFAGAFVYNGQTHVVYQNLQKNALSICQYPGEEIMCIPFDSTYRTHCFSNFIAWTNDTLWIGSRKEIVEVNAQGLPIIKSEPEPWFFLINLKTKTFTGYKSYVPTGKIFPIGKSYWYWIDGNTKYIYTWSDLVKLNWLISPYKVTSSSIEYFPVAYNGASFVEVNDLENSQLKFLNENLEQVFETNVLDFFPGYVQLEHVDPDANSNPITRAITVNDNCLLLYESYELQENKHFIEAEGHEQKLCWDFTNQTHVHFESKELDYYVSRVIPVRTGDQVCLWSWEWYPAGNWMKVYEPIDNTVLKR